MITLRPFRDNDAPVILSWVRSENELRLWSADRYGDYPPKAEDMTRLYSVRETEDYFPLTLCIDGAPAGHLILRYPGADKSIIRFGFVIVDPGRRNEGIGTALIDLAGRYAKEMLGAKYAELGVFASNLPALALYRKSGFTKTGTENYQIDGSSAEAILMKKEL